MTKLIRILSKLLSNMGGIAMLIVLIISILNPFTRLGWGATLTWSQTAAVWGAVLVGMFVAGVLLLEGGHVSIDLLPDRLKGLPRKVLLCFNSIVVVAFAIFLLFGGIGRMLTLLSGGMTNVLGTFRFPYWIIFLLFSTGLFLLSICSVIRVVTVFRQPSQQAGDRE